MVSFIPMVYVEIVEESRFAQRWDQVLKSKKIYLLERFTVFFIRLKYAKINAQKCVSQTVHLSQKDCSMSNNGSSPLVLWYNQLGMNDVDRVG